MVDPIEASDQPEQATTPIVPSSADVFDPLPAESSSRYVSTVDRLHYSLGPLAGGIILDITDFVTFGPIGIFFGLIIGVPVGWWIATIYGFSKPSRLAIALAAGIYCTVPFTELIPLATIVSAVARYHSRPPTSDEAQDG